MSGEIVVKEWLLKEIKVRRKAHAEVQINVSGELVPSGMNEDELALAVEDTLDAVMQEDVTLIRKAHWKPAEKRLVIEYQEEW